MICLVPIHAIRHVHEHFHNDFNIDYICFINWQRKSSKLNNNIPPVTIPLPSSLLTWRFQHNTCTLRHLTQSTVSIIHVHWDTWLNQQKAWVENQLIALYCKCKTASGRSLFFCETEKSYSLENYLRFVQISISFINKYHIKHLVSYFWWFYSAQQASILFIHFNTV